MYQPPQNPLAKQALDIYDNEGEKAMLAFISTRMEPKPPQAQENPHSLIILQDHTCIQSADFLYNFIWMGEGTLGRKTITVDRFRNRPAQTPMSERPRPSERS